MLEIHKSYVIDENPQPIAVKIPLEQFYKIEEILENYGLAKLIKQTEGDERLSKDQALKYYNSIKPHDKNWSNIIMQGAQRAPYRCQFHRLPLFKACLPNPTQSIRSPSATLGSFCK